MDPNPLILASIGLEGTSHHRMQPGALPVAVGEQAVGRAQRPDATYERVAEGAQR
jgi:hypothetical protein